MTVNRPDFSRKAFSTGVVDFQLWLFCPSTINNFSFSAADESEASSTRTTATVVSSNENRRIMVTLLGV